MSERKLFKFGFLFIVACSAALIMAGPVDARDGEKTLSVSIEAGSYDIQSTSNGHEITMEGFGRLLVPGKPNLPSKIFAIAVPPGATVDSVTFSPGDEITVPGTYDIPPATLFRVPGDAENPVLYQQDKEMYDSNYSSVYGSDAPYPSANGEFVRKAGFRKYNLVDVRFTPFTYHPESGKLIYHPSLNVEVGYTVPETFVPGAIHFENLPRSERTASEIVYNYNQAQSWYPSNTLSEGRGLHDFVIITLSSLTSAVQPLVDWETTKGRTVEVVTTDWISSNYTGWDLAAEMRMFLRDNLGSWGIEDVLLVGHYDDVHMRRCEQDVGYGKPETDLYFAELSLPDNQSWDSDNDHKYGENSDNIDFYSEVNVGRIPWSGATLVQSICNKSVAYELNNDPSFKKNILLPAAFFWSNTDNAVLMEYKTNPSLHPWMSDWTKTRLYEQGYSSYPMDYDLTWNNVKNAWSSGTYAFVNWAGHGNPTGCYIYYSSGPFVDTSTCSYLNDSYPAIIFADACSNSDTDYTNIGQKMLERGGVGFLGATKVAYGCPGWSNPNHGSSQSMDYYFTTKVTSGDYTQGAAHQWALRRMYTYGLWGSVKYEMFEWGAYWGSPDLGMGGVPPLSISTPQGLPEGYLPPGPETELVIQINNGLENYVPGSGLMYYRLDSGAYNTVGLTSMGGNLYTASLPNTKPGDTPEYYFSAQGDGGSTVFSPFTAPSDVYSFDIGFEEVVFEDDFETDMGWVFWSTNITTGEWERADPGSTDAQPGDDHSADGTMCYVTGKDGGGIGDDDVDGGPTYLRSPAIDLSSGDATVNFYTYFYHSTNGEQEPHLIQISGTGGSPWVTVEQIYNQPSWTLHSIKVSDYVTPSSSVKFRFISEDNPNDSVVEALLDDFEVIRVNLDPSLWAEAYSLSAATGGIVDFCFDAGSGFGNRNYLLLGSATGTSPGVPLPGGAVLPIKWDVLTNIIMSSLGSPVFYNFMGQLNASGQAAAALNTYGPLDPSVVGLNIYFAYMVSAKPSFFASNAITLTIDP